jgi:hypothetical protein
MKSQCKLIITILALTILLIIPSIAQAQALPAVRLTAPTVVQAEVGREFVIPLTITMGTQEGIVGSVRPIVEQTGIRVEERAINQIMAPNSTVNVGLTGVAQSTGLFRVRLEVDAAGFIFSTEVMVDVKDPDEAQKRARFSVSRASVLPSPADIDKPFTLTLDLKNTGDEPSGLVMATIAGAGNFSVVSLTNRADMPSVSPDETGKVSFILRAKDNRASNEVTLTLSYGTHTQTETLFLPLPDVSDPDAPPLLKVHSFTLTPAQEGQFVLNLTIINEGGSKAQNISLSIDAGGRAFPLAGGNVRTLKELAPQAKAEISYLLSSQGELSAHPVNIAFEFSDENKAARKGSDRIFIATNLEPLIRLAGFSVRAADEEGEFSLSLNFQNTGLSKASNIEIRFTGNQASPLNKGALVALGDIPAGGSRSLSLLMQTRLESETYTIPFEIAYRSQSGAEHKAADSVVVTSDSIGIDLEDQPGLLPIMLDRHTISEGIVLSGREFTLTLFVKNTSDEPTGNAKITLGEARAGNTGGSVFSSPDGRTSFHIETIPANGEIVKQITLFTDRNAQAMTYSLPVIIEYEDAEGKVSAVNTSVSIPVRHEGRFRVLTLDIPSLAAISEAVPLSMEFANTGRVNLENMFISLEGDFEKENATFFIPSFAFGTSDFFHATLFPANEGDLKGKIVITYDDADGSEIRVEHPFSIKVESAALSAEALSGNPRPGFAAALRMPSIPMWVYAVLLLLGAVVIVGIFLIVKKLKAKKG